MYLDKIQVGSRVAPREGLRVGFGVVWYIKESHFRKGEKVYTVLTDFGNEINFCEDEFVSTYTNEIYYEKVNGELLDAYAVDDLEERLKTQISNLQSVLWSLEVLG